MLEGSKIVKRGLKYILPQFRKQLKVGGHKNEK